LSSVVPYITKEVTFEFRGRIYEFALSHGLFSSAGIDRGSRFLLRVFSGLLDSGGDEGRGKDESLFPVLRRGKDPSAQPSARPAAGEIPPVETLSVLDAGCGCGVLGICAGGALRDLAGGKTARPSARPLVKVLARDRDELARLFTEYNGRRNGFAEPQLEVHTEALLAGPAGAAWDLILSNIPAKAGKPVLEDFIGRSAGMLKKGGLVLVVVVNPLAPWFRNSITARGFSLFHEEAGTGHTVFAWHGGSGTVSGGGAEDALREGSPPAEGVFPGGAAYNRGGGDFEMEGVRYHIDAVHGAAGFDRAGAAVLAAAKLAGKLGERIPACLAANPAVLIHEPDQGHFPAWFVRRFPPDTGRRFVLSGRNILSLEASRRNLERAADSGAVLVKTVSAVDIAISRDDLALSEGGGYGLAALFPELVPGTGRIAAYWEGLAALLAENGIAIIALNASDAEKFDRGKNAGPARFARLGDFRRGGFRALAYTKQ
jgi:hypothetical protein